MTSILQKVGTDFPKVQQVPQRLPGQKMQTQPPPIRHTSEDVYVPSDLMV